MRIVISGVSSGIGYELAKNFLNRGYEVIGCSRTPTDLKGMLFKQCDITKDEDLEEFASFVGRTFGSIDVLINNAGIAYVKKFEGFSKEEIDELVDTNLKGIMKKTLKLLPLLKEGSLIVNIGSIASIRSFEGWSVYNATKFGLRGWSRALRRELSEKGVRVCLVSPGAVWSPLWKKAGFERIDDSLNVEDVVKVVDFVVHLPKHVNVDEIYFNHVKRAFP